MKQTFSIRAEHWELYSEPPAPSHLKLLFFHSRCILTQPHWQDSKLSTITCLRGTTRPTSASSISPAGCCSSKMEIVHKSLCLPLEFKFNAIRAPIHYQSLLLNSLLPHLGALMKTVYPFALWYLIHFIPATRTLFGCYKGGWCVALLCSSPFTWLASQ